VRVRVSVKPGSREDAVSRQTDGSLLVCVRARAQEGAANAAVVAAVAGFLGVPKSHVRLVSGARGRSKVLDVPEA